MENEVATLDGFSGAMSKLFDKDMLKDMLMAAGGGALGGAVVDLSMKHITWLSTGTATWHVPAKRAGLAAALAIAGGAALWDKFPDVAKGLAGAMGAELARIGLSYAGVFNGLGDVRVRDSWIPFIESTGTFTGAGDTRQLSGKPLSGRVNVRNANPAAMAAINAYGA